MYMESRKLRRAKAIRSAGFAAWFRSRRHATAFSCGKAALRQTNEKE
jgi:hypothetical protein